MSTEKQPAVDENGAQLHDADGKPILLGDILQSMITGCITRDCFLPRNFLGGIDLNRVESVTAGELETRFFILYPSQNKIDEWQFRLTGEQLDVENKLRLSIQMRTLGEFSFFHHNLRVMRGNETVEEFAASLGVEAEDIYKWESYIKPATALDITNLLNDGDFHHRLDLTDGDLTNDFLRRELHPADFGWE